MSSTSDIEPGLDHVYPDDLFTKGALEETNRWVAAERISSPAPRSSSPVDVVIRAPGHGSNLPLKRIVIHRMEAPLETGVAVSVARYFASGAGGRGVAAHYSVDPGTTVLSVPDEELCYHAPPNEGSIGIEQAGYCANNDWRTPKGESLLHRTARLTTDLCLRHFLPIQWLSANDILAGKHGITSHHQVSLAYHQSSHTDPDPFFPLDYFMSLLPPEVHPVTGSPRVSIAWTPTGGGYYVLFEDGGVANYGDALPGLSTAGAQPAGVKAKSLSVNPVTKGIAVLYENGQIDTRQAPHFGEPAI